MLYEVITKPTPPRELVPLLKSYAFPGNIRELRSLVFDAVGAHQSRVLSMETFRRAIHPGPNPPQEDFASEPLKNPFAACESLPTLQQAVELLIDEAVSYNFV